MKKYEYHLFFLIFFALGLILYSHSFRGDFYFDDKPYILEYYYLQSLDKLWEFISVHGLIKNRLIPILTFYANLSLHGYETWGFRLFNLLIHVVNALLVFILVKHLIQQERKIKGLNEYESKVLIVLASCVSLLFFIHPLQTNAVTYIVQRMESIASMFYLLGLLSFIRWCTTKQRIWLLSCIPLFIFGLWSKDIIWTLPIACAVYFLAFQPRDWVAEYRQNRKLRIKWFAIISLSLIGMLMAIQLLSQTYFRSLPALSGPAGYFKWGMLENLMTQANVIVLDYLRLLVIPNYHWMAIEHPHQIYTELWDYPTFLTVTLILSLILFGVLSLFKRPLLAFGLLWFFILLIPSSSIIPLSEISVEYRVYLASMGLWLVLISFLSSLFENYRVSLVWIMAMFMPFYVFCFYHTYQQNKVLKTELTAWSQVLELSHLLPRPHLALGDRLTLDKDYGQALFHYQFAHLLKPDPETYSRLASTYAYQQRYELALDFFHQGLRSEKLPSMTSFVNYWKNVGRIYFYQGKYAEAEKYFVKALASNPETQIVQLLAQSYVKQGKLVQAIQMVEKNLNLIPDSSLYLTLADLYLMAGKPEASLKTIEAGQEFFREEHILDGVLIMAVANERLGNKQQSLGLYQLFINQSPPNHPRRQEVVEKMKSLMN